MDLKDLETTSTYAIKAVYDDFWSIIPNKYKLPEDDRKIHDMYPFYDPELTFENRLHYKLTNIKYPTRSNPWFVITWNPENGLMKSSLTQRRFQTKVIETKEGKRVRFKFINSEMEINFGIACNTMQGLFELQENFLLRRREKMVCYTDEHPLLGRFPVSLDVIDSTQNKLSRDKSTLCYLMLQCKIDYPVIGVLNITKGGLINEIHTEIDKDTGKFEEPQVLSKDIIK